MWAAAINASVTNQTFWGQTVWRRRFNILSFLLLTYIVFGLILELGEIKLQKFLYFRCSGHVAFLKQVITETRPWIWILKCLFTAIAIFWRVSVGDLKFHNNFIFNPLIYLS